MKYAMLIYERPGYVEALSEDEQEGMFGEYTTLRDDPRRVASGQLQPIETATTVRVQDGQTLTTDGPYADTKEVFGGYYVCEVDNLDEAIDLAARIPAAVSAARSRSGRWWRASAAGRGFPRRVGARACLAGPFPRRFRSR